MRAPSAARVRLAGAALMLLVGSFLLGSAVLMSDDRTTPWPILMGGGALVLVFGYLVGRDARRFRIVLHPDRIEVHGISDRTILRSQISGYRADSSGNFALIGARGRVLRVFQATFDVDPEFKAWFADLVDLDQQDFTRAADEALSVLPSSQTRDQGLARLQAASQLSRTIELGLAGVLFWFAIHPRPYVPLAIVSVLIPPVAIALWFAFRPLVRVRTVRGWLGIDMLLMLAGGVLAIRAIFDAHPLEWSRVALVAVLLTVPVALLIQRLAPEDRARTTLVASLFVAAYFLGVVALGNELLDRSTPVLRDLRVLEVHGWAKTHRRCGLTVQGLTATPRRLTVGCARLKGIKVGQPVRVELLAGAFGIPWWR